MRLSQIFLLGRNLDKRVEALQRKKIIKPKKGFDEEKKRKIFIYHQKPFNNEEDNMLARVYYSSEKKGYFMEIKSAKEFYFPVSDNPIDWATRARTEATAFLKDDNSLIRYLEELQQTNNAVLKWSNENFTSSLKKDFEDYPLYLD